MFLAALRLEAERSVTCGMKRHAHSSPTSVPCTPKWRPWGRRVVRWIGCRLVRSYRVSSMLECSILQNSGTGINTGIEKQSQLLPPFARWHIRAVRTNTCLSCIFYIFLDQCGSRNPKLSSTTDWFQKLQTQFHKPSCPTWVAWLSHARPSALSGGR